jgi:hypothetical protein
VAQRSAITQGGGIGWKKNGGLDMAGI